MLKPIRQQHALTLDYCTPDTSERGGVLHFVEVSGIQMVRYLENPSGYFAAGIQFHDVEYIDYSRQVDPRRNRETTDPYSAVGIITNGEFITDWIHNPSGTIMPGTRAYAGPSGTITNVNTYGGCLLGYFMSTLTPVTKTLVYRGLGFSTSYMDPITKQVVTENDPANRTLVISDGHAKVRIDPAYILRGRS